MTAPVVAAPANHSLDLARYFEFIPAQGDARRAIRVADARVGVEFVLRDYLEGASAEALALRFPSLSLEQIHALITYYLARKEEMDTYLAEVWRDAEQDADAALASPTSFEHELRERLIKARSAKLALG